MGKVSKGMIGMAIGTHQDDKGEWVITVMKFDPVCGEFEVVETHNTNSKYSPDRDHRFKVTAVQHGIVA
jgi:hypothetical protein